MRRDRLLCAGLFSLGGFILVYAVLGPLILGVIRFRTSVSGLNQIQGGDLAALAVVAPVSLLVGLLAWRGHVAAPALALAPAMFAIYTYSQLILANEYLQQPGNIERFFPLLLAIFLLAAAVVLRSWRLAQPERLPVPSRRLERGSGIFLIVVAAFVVIGIHLPNFIDAIRDHPTSKAYLAAPTTFWVIKFYDLGIVVPSALTVGIGLVRRTAWARKPAYAILGGYVLLGWSVAGMAWVMLINSDPDATLIQALGITGLAGAGAVFGYFLYRPLFRSAIDQTVLQGIGRRT